MVEVDVYAFHMFAGFVVKRVVDNELAVFDVSCVKYFFGKFFSCFVYFLVGLG